MLSKRSKKQFVLFTIIGGAQYLLDVLLLYLLLRFGIDIVTANLFSRGVVGLAGFIANRFLTFHDTTTTLGASFPRFLIAWIGTSAASTFLIVIALQLFFDGDYSTNLAVLVKIVVELIVFLAAFLIQKFWIFPASRN
ncbi:MAG: GtrA family protein [Halioglobus sp.]